MDFIQKVITLEKTIAAEKGDFVLFALLKRTEVTDLWDLLLSAPWFGSDEKGTLDFIVRKMKDILTPQEMVLFSRIVLFPPDDPRVQQILRLVQQPVNHGHVELFSWTLSSMPISHAHIITATDPRRPQSASH